MKIARNYIRGMWDAIKGRGTYCVKVTTRNTPDVAVTNWMNISEEQAERIMAIVGEGNADE